MRREKGERGRGEGEESGGDIAEMRWRMKGGKEEGGERDRESEGSRGKRTDERTGRWEIFNTHFAKTILPRRPQDELPSRQSRRSAANGMALISRQFVDPSLLFV